MELEITWNRALKVWWSYLWRNLIAIICSMLIGGIIGGVIGFIMGGLGASEETIRLAVTPVGFVIGLAISIIPIKLILGKNFGEFRLVLLQSTDQHSTSGWCGTAFRFASLAPHPSVRFVARL